MQLSIILVQLWNEWEIRLLVLLSFTLQLFLFFTGGLRRRSSNKLLRFSIWLAYLGADMIAFYTLGQISRLGDSINSRDPFTGTMSLAFFWAPFLLVHLGGQDTITAFSSEDNNLWLRHFLNLLVEVSLALYVFWKSMGNSNQLLIPAMFVFVSGIIKYGERIWALKYGSKDDLNSTTSNYENNQLPLLSAEQDRYCDIVCYALHTARYIRGFLAGRATFQMGHEIRFTLVEYFGRFAEHGAKLKIIEMELAIIYDDLYTKAVLFRSWTGSIFRCVVHISTVVAFVLFYANRKESYSRVDIAITYALLIGSIFMELVSVLMAMVSPWAWAFLKARNFHWLTNLFWSTFNIVQPDKRLWWSDSMGQYNLLRSIFCIESPTIGMIRNIINFVGWAKVWKHLRHTKDVKAKHKIMECVVQWLDKQDRFDDLAKGMRPRLSTELELILRGPFEHAILQLHLFTDYHIRGLLDEEGSPLHNKGDRSNLASICEEISNYMIYLLVVNPSMLPVSTTAEDTLALFPEKIFSTGRGGVRDVSSLVLDKLKLFVLQICNYFVKESSTAKAVAPAALGLDLPLSTSQKYIREVLHKDWSAAGEIEGKILLGARALLDFPDSELTIDELLVEIKEIWIRLLVYAAGKSHAEAHAQQMSRGGGELLTFVWLLMAAHYELGDVARRLDLVTSSSGTAEGDRLFAFIFPSYVQPTPM
ncbi:uncharacterized protein LOC123406736 isoform X1 [Hordeum vulgare subsp. vulgare]|uniref:Uncharacterized protein n=2 Tax=Hordeum vulgare subsp. vulgare TaxID=112509 RepID=M0YVU6_HORVV|nr:uncharacterized protein LOC123406736 isoform X1 [Hordeum vulgare subsp. vulgare]XP_044955860.1 uncharacterized protein LOC123406736 isoform X1 [Hordeum vulgare subsp. vulgare]XP_044955861.1 uncharacterized protein LOC123406736 isoform X1 [Hordeum vulgare subsp. vulgare]XP_044955862.1 uncharacterized protein LOC123406736 isoform X1 [Hordeum vulgare subsp. vulgare]KAI5022527.1 hypothetical protein ZWY2020_059257 [Hordeum vulgare]